MVAVRTVVGGRMRQRDSSQRLGVGAASLFAVIAASGRAQESSAGAQLSVVEPDSCISESRVRERVQEYRGGAEVASELRVRVERREGVLGFVVLRSGEAVARRQLKQLSAACDERLDSLAIAITVALTNASAAQTNKGAASPTLAAPSGVEATTPMQRGTPAVAIAPRALHSKGEQSSRQPSTTVDATGDEPANSHRARSGAAAPDDAIHARSAELQPTRDAQHARSAEAPNARSASIAAPPIAAFGSRERAPAAPGEAQARDAQHARGADAPNARAASLTAPPTAASGPREPASVATRESQTRDAQHARGAELQQSAPAASAPIASPRNAGGTELERLAARVDNREAHASSVDQTSDAQSSRVGSPPSAATSSSAKRTVAATREAKPREGRDVSDAAPRAGIESRGADRSDSAFSPPAARAGTASRDASARTDARASERPAAARGDGPRTGDVGMMAGARYGLELLPDPLLLFDVGIEVGLSGVVSLEAGGLVSPVKETAADGGRMRAQVTGGELLLCARPTAANVMLRWCAGLAAASVAVRGEAFFVDRSTRLAWGAGLMRAAVRWPADSPVAAELSLGGHANLVRPRMRVLRSSEPDRVSWILGGSLGLQLVVSLR
jgi:hypothetical protein